MINPYQEMFDKIKEVSESLGFDTYDYLPDEFTKYPFVFVGEMFQNDELTKTKNRGQLNILLHVFDHHDRRKQAQEMLNKLFAEVSYIGETEHFKWHEKQSEIHIMFDNSDSTPFVHGVLDMVLEFA